MKLTDRDRIIIDEAIKLMKEKEVYIFIVKETSAISVNGNRKKVTYNVLYGTEDEREEIGEAYADMCGYQDYNYSVNSIGEIQFRNDHEIYVEEADW
ncbi:hypothetical protein KY326_04045 [Candidatus Woesearchaeota archaeon]|nr:hypothetical protein [Candidatus Woesearchaeota archaeon]